jgi:hypothetical protein
LIKQLLRKTGKLFFLAKAIKRAFIETFNSSKRPIFDGWYGLITYTQPPWENLMPGISNVESRFYEVDCNLREQMSNKSFILLRDDMLKTIDLMDKLRWRNYIVFWSFVFAAKSTKSEIKNYVEAGVADGISAFYAINAAESYNYKYKAFFYDAWGAVQMSNPSTKGEEVGYEELDLEIIKNNLKTYTDNLVFIKGKIPDTFNGKNEPETIVWLSIDLNSAQPTIDTMEYYWDKIEVGGVVLLDDYGQPAYIDTKIAIDNWVSYHNDSLLLHLPTTQAIIIKNN